MCDDDDTCRFSAHSHANMYCVSDAFAQGFCSMALSTVLTHAADRFVRSPDLFIIVVDASCDCNVRFFPPEIYCLMERAGSKSLYLSCEK